MVFIENIRDKAVLRLDQINPQLYAHSRSLNVVKVLSCYSICQLCYSQSFKLAILFIRSQVYGSRKTKSCFRNFLKKCWSVFFQDLNVFTFCITANS